MIFGIDTYKSRLAIIADDGAQFANVDSISLVRTRMCA